MLEIKLPDGSFRTYECPVTVQAVAADIGAGLAKAALAGRINGRLVDLDYVIEADCDLAVVTATDCDGVAIIRHSAAHLLAHAVKTLYPEAQVTIGPVIEDGFYYDFAYEPGFSEGDLETIENQMLQLAKQDLKVERTVMSRQDAVQLFRDMGEHYKAEIIRDIPANEEITLYRQGDFIDLCRGPHVPNTGRLKAFTLTKLAGAYWRGDSRNAMLQRIYGTAWPDKKQLKAYLTRLEEAAKRDHRKLGRHLDLFHFQDEAPGMVFWHSKGWVLYQVIENYMRRLLDEYDYQEVQTPELMDRSLWERSGHWDKFQENMFTTEVENRDYALKPMNCPGHVQVFNQGLRSYRDLPLRIGEFGIVHRYEASGTLHGLLRVRRFTQDDAHVFCTEEQIHSEVNTLIDLAYRVYGDFGFSEIDVGLSTRPEERVGANALWDKSERALENALNDRALGFSLHPGEGAFYGPKIDFTLKDSIGRSWQCGTIQVDFSMPGRLGAHYIADDGSKQVPVMIHRAILGSMERFIGILIEDHAGKLPTWLAPVQAVLMTITDRHREYARSARKTLKIHGIRADVDLRNEKIGFKIREHTLQRVPYLLVVGDREVQDQTVAVRTRDGEDLGPMTMERLMDVLTGDVAEHGFSRLEE